LLACPGTDDTHYLKTVRECELQGTLHLTTIKALSLFTNNITTLSCSFRKTSYLQIAAVCF